MKKIKRSVWVVLVLFVYITAITAYLAPRNTEISSTEKTVTIVSSYVVLFLLWLVLRRREKLKSQRLKEDEELRKNKTNNKQ